MRSGFLNKLPFAPVVGAMFGTVAAILALATPQWLFEQAIARSFLPGLISAATPPLGDKARIMAVIIAAALIGGLVWLITAQAEKLLAANTPIKPAKPVARGHGIAFLPDTPPRPLFAEADLGAPFMSDEAVAFGLEELVLDSAMIQKFTPAEPAVVDRSGRAMESVGAMLDRLEEALDRRSTVAGNSPPRPGDMRSLQAALGIAA